METPSRYTANDTAVNAIRLRNSGTRDRLANPSSTEDLRRAARRRDHLACLGAERVHADRQGMGELAVPQALDRTASAREPARAQLLDPDRASGGKNRQAT